jgi:hypothetical protein
MVDEGKSPRDEAIVVLDEAKALILAHIERHVRRKLLPPPRAAEAEKGLRQGEWGLQLADIDQAPARPRSPAPPPPPPHTHHTFLMWHLPRVAPSSHGRAWRAPTSSSTRTARRTTRSRCCSRRRPRPYEEGRAHLTV